MSQPIRLVAYERVSTARQGRSGLGLDAQREAIDRFAAERGAAVVGRFIEVESGRKQDSPELQAALHLAKVTGATLVIAKLDRLSRNAAFLLTLRDSGVRFVAADMPEANDLTVGVMALVAEQERRAISPRTKEALAAAKARGVKLGNPNGAAALRRSTDGGAALRRTVTENADAFARDLAPVVEAIGAEGIVGPRGFAEAPNARGMLTRRGGRRRVSNARAPVERPEMDRGRNYRKRMNSVHVTEHDPPWAALHAAGRSREPRSVSSGPRSRSVIEVRDRAASTLLQPRLRYPRTLRLQ